nr:MAG TPA: hypothetical protein [Caudoviricetes sp.]
MQYLLRLLQKLFLKSLKIMGLTYFSPMEAVMIIPIIVHV